MDGILVITTMATTALAIAVIVLISSVARFWWPTKKYGLSAGEVRLITAYCQTILSTVEWGKQVPPDALLSDIAASVRGLPHHIRIPFRFILWVVERMPLLVLVSPFSFSRLSLEQRYGVLERAAENPWTAISGLVEVLQGLCAIPLGGRPEILAICNFDREAQIASCVAERKRVMSEGGNSA
ncbi:hypothetical protein WDW86_01045 [Bdellovibrionota bacterium FG-2]